MRCKGRKNKYDFFIREIFELFNAACIKTLQCGSELAFDETLYANFGRGFGFKQFMKSKPAKYGLLYKSLNDAEVPYTYTSHIYAGKPASTPTENYIVGVEETVLSALNRYGAVHELKGRNLTFDRFYTSIDLADKLLEDHQMTCVGTLNNNRKGLPEKFKSLAGRPEKDYMPLFEVDGKKSIHSWVTNTKSGPKNVMILTTTVPLMGTTKDDEKEKPAIFKRYDFCMGGTDRVDQLMQSKTVRIKSNRWTMSVLCYMLDTARVNARTVALLQNSSVVPDTRDFGYDLVRDLVTPHIKRRVQMHGIQRYVKIKAESYFGNLKFYITFGVFEVSCMYSCVCRIFHGGGGRGAEGWGGGSPTLDPGGDEGGGGGLSWKFLSNIVLLLIFFFFLILFFYNIFIFIFFSW